MLVETEKKNQQRQKVLEYISVFVSFLCFFSLCSQTQAAIRSVICLSHSVCLGIVEWMQCTFMRYHVQAIVVTSVHFDIYVRCHVSATGRRRQSTIERLEWLEE